MIPAKFDYVRPTTVDDAVAALVAGGDDAKVITGGQSLLPLLRIRLAAPTVLVDCGRIADMLGVTDAGDSLVIGAATTHHDVMTDPLVKQHAPLLSLTAATVADPAIRHRGTFGGSLAHADPAGDMPTAALALDCVMVVAGPSGRREVPAADFFVDLLHQRSVVGRGAGRRPGAQAGSRLGLRVHEVPPHRPVLGDGRGGRCGPQGERLDRRGAGRADEHGANAATGVVRGGCPEGCVRHRRGSRLGRRKRRRRHSSDQ